MQRWNITHKALCVWGLGLSVLWGAGLWLCIPPVQVGGYGIWLPLFLLGVVGLTAAVIDWHSHILPDLLTLYVGIPVIVAYAGALAYTEFRLGFSAYVWLPPVMGAGLGFGLMRGLQWMLRRQNGGHEQMGAGDVKLMLVLGALVGPTGLLPTLILACLLLYPFARIRRSSVLPFGPSLTLSALMVTLSGVQWPV